jgi:hypothetical protein
MKGKLSVCDDLLFVWSTCHLILLPGLIIRDDVSYVMLSFNPNEGLIAQRTRGRPRKITGDVVSSDDTENLIQMFDSNKFERNGKHHMLLIFMFASDQEIRQLYMHPEVAMIDTTFKTNRQKKNY